MIERLFPAECKLKIERMELRETELKLFGVTTQDSASCPECGTESRRQNASYTRHPADLPCLGYQVRLDLRVKRYFCDNDRCHRKTFAERFPQLLGYKARRTERLTNQQLAIGFEVGGEAGRRVLETTKMPLSGDSLIENIRTAPELVNETPRVLGIDDWAKRKGKTYGTIMVDLETGDPVDLLDSRNATDVEAWLLAHPGIEIVSRDRSKEYKKAVTSGAPEAKQVADRWHLLKNLRDAVEQMLVAQPDCLKAATQLEAVIETSPSELCQSIGDDWQLNDQIATRCVQEIVMVEEKPVTKAVQLQMERRNEKEQRFLRVKELAASGHKISDIEAEVGVAYRTVKKYIAAENCPHYTTGYDHPSKLDPHLSYIEARWQAGCTNATQLWRELCTERGFTGSRGLVGQWAIEQRKLLPLSQRYARQQAVAVNPPISRQVTPKPLSASQAAWLFVRDATKLETDEQQMLTKLTQSHPLLTNAYTLVQSFNTMVRSQGHLQLVDWIESALASGLAQLTSFAAGLQQDFDEVYNALCMVWNSGCTEGNVNRLKFIKRQMYGRANFDLLRKRVLYRSPKLPFHTKLG